MPRLPQPVAAGVSPQAACPSKPTGEGGVPAASRVPVDALAKTGRKDPEAGWMTPSGTFFSSLPKILLILLVSLLIDTRVQAQDTKAVPPNIRVIVEYIEVPRDVLTEVMLSKHADSGPKLHARMRNLTTDGKAKVLETSIQTARSGEKATAESITEYIYPTEYYPSGLDLAVRPRPVDNEDLATFKMPLRPPYFQYFETRNVGITLEVEPRAANGSNIVDLRFAPEVLQLLRLDTWLEHKDQWGDASMKWPIFSSVRCSTSATLHDGQFGFVGVLTPTKKDGGPDTTRKIMLFVRADVMTIENPARSNP